MVVVCLCVSRPMSVPVGSADVSWIIIAVHRLSCSSENAIIFCFLQENTTH